MPDELPEKIADRYIILERIGKGGMGVVYKATDSLLCKTVAIKLLANFTLNMAQRFQREARAVAQLRHSNIIEVIDFGLTPENEPYMVMDYVEGVSLDSVIKQHGIVPLHQALPIIEQLCSAIRHAHEKGILHRDIKPSNVMLTQSDGIQVAKLLDFGLAKAFVKGQSLTTTGGALGSPPYMSPEQVKGETLDERTDVYSFGCLMFELLAGKPPILGSSAIETMDMKLKIEPPSLAAVSGIEFDTETEVFVSNCLQRKADDRFRSFDELAPLLSALNDLVSDFENPSSAETLAAPGEKQSRRWREPLAVAAVVLLLLVVGGFAVQQTFVAPPEEPPTIKDTEIPPLSKKEKKLIDLQEPSVRLISSGTNMIWKLTFATDEILSKFVREKKDARIVDLENLLASKEAQMKLASLEELNTLMVSTTWLDRQLKLWFPVLPKLKNLTALSVSDQLPDDEALDCISKVKSLDVLTIRGRGAFTRGGDEKACNFTQAAQPSVLQRPAHG